MQNISLPNGVFEWASIRIERWVVRERLERFADESRRHNMAAWPSGLRRRFKAPVRKGTSSNLVAVTPFLLVLASLVRCCRWRLIYLAEDQFGWPTTADERERERATKSVSSGSHNPVFLFYSVAVFADIRSSSFWSTSEYPQSPFFDRCWCTFLLVCLFWCRFRSFLFLSLYSEQMSCWSEKSTAISLEQVAAVNNQIRKKRWM